MSGPHVAPLAWPCPLPGGGTAGEWALALETGALETGTLETGAARETGAAHRLLVVPALFDEGNRLRRLTVSTMRYLAAAGIDCFLPDLPGLNESMAQLAIQTPGDWQLAMEGAARHFEATHVLAMRGGALVAPRGRAGHIRQIWHYAPTSGASQLKHMLRARILAAREAGLSETTEALLAQGRTCGLILSGYRLGADFIREMQGLVVAKSPDIVTLDQAMLPGAGLWLRAEPGEDAEQAQMLAAIIHAGIAAEAGA